MENFGRFIVPAGLILIIIGGGICIAGRLRIPLGRLPEDIYFEGKGGAFYVPIATSIIVSLILTVVLNILIHILRR